MLCGGLTVFSPLIRNGAGPGKKVGVIGIGGLVCHQLLFLDRKMLIAICIQGHYAILFAKALGCEVYAFSHSSNKEKDCKEMGVDHYVLDSPGFHNRYVVFSY